MADKDAVKGSPEVPLTEEDAAHLAETLETLSVIGKAPAGMPVPEKADAAADTAVAGAGETAEGKGAASSKKASDIELAVFGGRRAKAAADAPATTADHRFWNTQPVPKLEEKVEEHGPIDEPKTVEDVRKEPYSLPAGFEWCTLDIHNPAERLELYELLRDNYVEDDDAMFRFAYSQDFLLWALTPPHYYPDWLVGVRNGKTGRLMASITGVPSTMAVYAAQMPMCEINFLCVHKKLRSKRLAPVLIKEVTRRVNLRGIWQAAYTAGVKLPKPVASCQYWHRSIQPKKLIEVGFSRLAPRMTMARTIRLYQLPEACPIPGMRVMRASDVPAVARLLNAYLASFAMRPVLSEEEVAHWLLPREGVIDSFVVDAATALAEERVTAAGLGLPEPAGPAAVHPASGCSVTDFVSFYHLPSSIIGHEKHKELRAVYSYYNVPGAAVAAAGGAGAAAGDAAKPASAEASASAGADAEGGAAAAGGKKKGGKKEKAGAGGAAAAAAVGHTLPVLMEAALVLAKERDVDVFNALDLMDNDPAMLKDLKFGPGDGHLQYYLFNWACPEMPPKGVGLVLL